MKRLLIITGAGLLMLAGACSPAASGIDGSVPTTDGATATDRGAAAGDSGPRGDAIGVPPKPSKTVFGGKRPVRLEVPAAYDARKKYPLLVMLHGYTASGAIQRIYFGHHRLVESEGILFAAPDGTTSRTGQRFWNATDVCCDFFRSGVDDVAYLTGLIKEIQAAYNVDKKRIFLIGHSNGGYMSYRMACDRANLVAAIVSLAGATFLDRTKCKPSEKVSVLQVHGTLDTTVPFNGGAAVPSASATVERWATYNGCKTKRITAPPKLALATTPLGTETSVSTSEGCPAGIAADLWTMAGVGHVPIFSKEWVPETWKWLKAHPKP